MSREQLAAVYLDYFNNFLTVKRYAEYYGLYEAEARALIDLARKCHEAQHPEK